MYVCCVCVCVVFLEGNTQNQVGQGTFLFTLYSTELFEGVIFTI